MRHRRKGRKLGRNPSHQRALLRSLASNLLLTEREPDDPLFDKKLDPLAPNPPRVGGRIVTTISKAKEVRPLVEKCVTIAKKSLASAEAAEEFAAGAERGTEAWKSWRQSERWREWAQAMAPAVAARRRCVRLLGDKEAVSILFAEVAPRYVDRPGGYTRIVRLAKPRLGDNGTRAILEFVGKNDRVVERAQKPAFDAPEGGEPTEDEPALGQEAEHAADADPQPGETPDQVPPQASGDTDPPGAEQKS